MILQALTDYYQTMAMQGKIAQYGWEERKVAYALCIGADGELKQVISLQTGQEKKAKEKKAKEKNKTMSLPAAVKRSSGISANFLCDTSSYILGVDKKENPQRAWECFQASKQLHERLLSGVESPAAKAVLAFFEAWQPEQARTSKVFSQYEEDLLSGGNLVFWYNGAYVQEDVLVRQAWGFHFQTENDGPQMVCLVTGKHGPIESIHPAIKNVYGAQSSGAALISFNEPAFCSYGKEQNYNAPTSKYASFAYTAALNHLLADQDHVYRMGDTTVVCWARNGGDMYSKMMGWAFFDQESTYSLSDMQSALKNLCQGNPVIFDKERLNPDMEFYILGLSPNAARLSVRFFLRDSFGAFLQNVQAHQKRLEIVSNSKDKSDIIPLWKILNETVNQNSRDKKPSPNLAGETMRAILRNLPYPATLLNGVILRIRAERNITRGRAAILKAYYLKHPHPDIPKEVLTVQLNDNSTNIPYNLGRLFSVLEALQFAANPNISATIRDKYFNSASATPAIVFPILINLAQKHLKKLNVGLRTYYDKQITVLLGKIGEQFPARMNLPQQGAFQLGYYHQTQLRFEKKEEK